MTPARALRNQMFNIWTQSVTEFASIAVTST
jgi:hypothetical protein